MKPKLTFSIILLLLSALTFSLYADESSVSGEIIVQIKRDVTNTQLSRSISSVSNVNAVDIIANKYGGKVDVTSVRRVDTNLLIQGTKTLGRSLSSAISEEKTVLKLSDVQESDMKKVIEELKKLDEVQFAEPNYLFYQDDFNATESNPRASEQWYLDKNSIKEAWALFDANDTSKLQNVVVAILDSGVDYNHEDLKDAMWRNPGEIPANNIDDDNNGYVDDVYGANVLYKSYNSTASAAYTDPMDNHGHGTHVAGIIGAVNNDLGIIGVASGVKIIAIKCARADGSLTTEDIVKALDYARSKNAHVANMSFGGPTDSSIVKNALADLSVTTALVASAGNSHKPVEYDLLDSCGMKGILPLPNFPAAYSFVLGVEANDNAGALAGFSNCDPLPYSSLEYEVRLPGVGVMSTLPGNAYAAWNGTSMAAPMASALAALIKAKQWDNGDVFTNRMVQAQVAKYASNFSAALTQLPKPDLKYYEHSIVDFNTTGGDNDGIADAGETVTLAMKIKNYWGAAKDVKLKVSPGFIINGTSTFSADQFVTIKDSNGANGSKIVDIPAIGSYTIGSNGVVTDEYGNITDVTLPIELIVDAQAPNLHRAVFTVELEYKNAIDETDTTTYTSGPIQFSFDLQNGVEKQGVIISDETWPANSRIIVTGPLAVEDGVTLTIEEGTDVRFVNGAYLKAIGKIIANGSKNNKIHFHNNEGLVYRETWRGLRFHENPQDEQVSIFNYVIIEGQTYPELTSSVGEYLIGGHDFIVKNSIIKNFQYFLGYNASGLFESCIIDSAKPLQNLNSSFLGRSLKISSSLLSNMNSVWNNKNYINYDDINNSVIEIPRTFSLPSLSIFSSPNDNLSDDLSEKLYIMGQRSSLSSFLEDYSDTFNLDDIRLSDNGDNDEMLSKTMPTPPSTTPAFLVSAEWLDSSDVVKTVLEVGSTYKLRLTFNKEKMNTLKQPLVSFGSLYPYTDKEVIGDWIDPEDNGVAKVWEAEYTVTSFSGTGVNTIRVNGAEDTDMMYDAPLSEIYQFSIVANGAQALVLQALGGAGKVDISWMQDDYEFVGGYNLYRGQIADDAANYTKINPYPILGLNYTDTDVLPGETYYYTFKAILSDGSLSPDSNIASATVLDSIAPTINHTPITKIHPGDAAWITATITDNISVSSAKIYYKVKNSGAFISADMAATGTPNQYSFTIASSYFNEGANVEYYIETTDSTGNVTTMDTKEIAVTNADVAPTIAQVANISVAENSGQFSVSLDISDVDGESFGVAVSSSNPSILSVTNYDSTNVSLTPQTDQYGTVTVTVTASNALETSMSFNVTVTHSDSLPTIAILDNIAKVKEFEDFNVSIVAEDLDGDAITLSIVNSSPDIIEATLQGNEILISSLAYAVGHATITVTATANGKSVSRSFLVEVLLADNGTTNTYNFQLNTGWNLVGFIPYMSSVVNLPSSLTNSENVYVIWQYDTDNSTWLGYTPDSVLAPLLAGKEITDIKATDGIWIYGKKPVLVTFINPPEPTTTSNDIVLKDGWNLISSPDGSSIDPASFTNASLVWAYDMGTWKVYSNDPNTIAAAQAASIEIIQSLSGTVGFWVLK